VSPVTGPLCSRFPLAALIEFFLSPGAFPKQWICFSATPNRDKNILIQSSTSFIAFKNKSVLNQILDEWLPLELWLPRD
jgi:hypothetical protein